MSSLELQQRVKAEIEQNPALEIPPERSVSIERISAAESKSRPEDDFGDSSGYDPERFRSDVRLSSYYDQEAADRNQQYIEGGLANSETLQEYCSGVGVLAPGPIEIEYGNTLISNLDAMGSTGILRRAWSSRTGRRSSFDAPIVQNLDPPGIAAADFREIVDPPAKAGQPGTG